MSRSAVRLSSLGCPTMGWKAAVAVAKLPDDRLMTEEFLRRHAKNAIADEMIAVVTPDNHHRHHQQDKLFGSSYNEEETISSTLYFDHKYSHVVQTRPPMPLFREDMLSTRSTPGGSCRNELSEMIKKRSS